MLKQQLQSIVRNQNQQVDCGQQNLVIKYIKTIYQLCFCQLNKGIEGLLNKRLEKKPQITNNIEETKEQLEVQITKNDEQKEICSAMALNSTEITMIGCENDFKMWKFQNGFFDLRIRIKIGSHEVVMKQNVRLIENNNNNDWIGSQSEEVKTIKKKLITCGEQNIVWKANLQNIQLNKETYDTNEIDSSTCYLKTFEHFFIILYTIGLIQVLIDKLYDFYNNNQACESFKNLIKEVIFSCYEMLRAKIYNSKQQLLIVLLIQNSDFDCYFLHSHVQIGLIIMKI